MAYLRQEQFGMEYTHQSLQWTLSGVLIVSIYYEPPRRGQFLYRDTTAELHCPQCVLY